MKNPSINTNSFNIHKLVALSQEWKMSGAYSYLDNPRPDNGLSLILKGKFIYTFLDNSFFTAQSGDVIYIPKGINYKVYFISDSDKSSINASLINFILINDEGKEFLFNDKITKIYEDSSGKLTQIFHKIIDLYMKNRILKAKSLCYKVFDEILSENNEKNMMSLDDAIKYIKLNFNTPISISDIAQKCAMSESHFRRVFKERIKMSPVKYINTLRVEKAKELLRSSKITIEEISAFLNFYDKSYFYKIFKNHTGLSPFEYRSKYI
ncbi:MAG: helix-turn-helix transcriptional regulator [Ruminococcaceae bacterium]|nr:helix-turn-helix transcriptional regulator [Oscillospiraceae bacterium]